jgi:hypothetical protein
VAEGGPALVKVHGGGSVARKGGHPCPAEVAKAKEGGAAFLPERGVVQARLLCRLGCGSDAGVLKLGVTSGLLQATRVRQLAGAAEQLSIRRHARQ